MKNRKKLNERSNPSGRIIKFTKTPISLVITAEPLQIRIRRHKSFIIKAHNINGLFRSKML